MNGPGQQLPLQASERASFHEDPAIANALELASVNPRIATRNDGEFVVVNLENNDSSGGANGEGSDWKSTDPKYGSLGDDVELGPRTEGKHVSNASKDDAAEGETVCRVCHLGLTSGNSESIVLGCACKQDLALCHRDCAEEWFKIRGNTVCEICGETAKNVHILEPVETTAARLEVAGGAEANTQVRATTMTRLRYCWQRQLVRNALLVSLVVVCTVPWFFRVIKFGM